MIKYKQYYQDNKFLKNISKYKENLIPNSGGVYQISVFTAKSKLFRYFKRNYIIKGNYRLSE